MKFFVAALCALSAFTCATAGQLAATAPPRPANLTATHALTPDEQLFTGLIEQVGAAISKGDMAALGKYMVPDYTHYSPNNGIGHKADELAYIATWSPTTVKLMGPVQVSHAGNMAVTVSKSLYSSTENGKATSRTIQHMIAWTLSGGNWQMIIIQSKDVPA